MTLHETLTSFVTANLPVAAQPEVDAPRRLGGGSSQENWAFEASWLVDGHRVEHDLLLRRDPPAGVVDTDRAVEFALVQALGSTELPVPAAYWYAAGDVFDRPAMIVSRCAGRAHRAVLRERDPLGLGRDGQVRLAGELVELLGAVHQVDPSTMADALTSPDGNPAAVELDHWVRELDRAELEPQPALRFTAEWLREHQPAPPERITLVHGDFRPANVLVHDGHVTALLDWELARIGDPADDLGWYLASVYAGEHLIPGRWERADFLARYAQRCPVPDEDRLRYWAVLAVFRLAVIALTAVRNFCTGASTRLPPAADPLVAAALADTGWAP